MTTGPIPRPTFTLPVRPPVDPDAVSLDAQPMRVSVPTGEARYSAIPGSDVFHCGDHAGPNGEGRWDARELAIDAGYRPCKVCEP